MFELAPAGAMGEVCESRTVLRHQSGEGTLDYGIVSEHEGAAFVPEQNMKSCATRMSCSFNWCIRSKSCG